MALNFEWDQAKARINVKRHRITFEEAKTVFEDPFSITILDTDHSLEEERYIDIGMSVNGRVLIVAYTERRTNIRIISCRKATRWERMIYEEHTD